MSSVGYYHAIHPLLSLERQLGRRPQLGAAGARFPPILPGRAGWFGQYRYLGDMVTLTDGKLRRAIALSPVPEELLDDSIFQRMVGDYRHHSLGSAEVNGRLEALPQTLQFGIDRDAQGLENPASRMSSFPPAAAGIAP